jgi:hypothetical protein
MATALPRDWQQFYGHPVYLAGTFIDPGRFRGTCYRAANWKLLGLTTGRGKDDMTHRANRPVKEVLGYPCNAALPGVAEPVMKKKTPRRRLDVNVEELDRVTDGSENGPLSEADRHKLKAALHALVESLERRRNTEKTSTVPREQESAASAAAQPEAARSKPAGHGRNGAEAFRGAEKVKIDNQELKSGDRCPDCARGNVHEQKEPKVLVRIIGQAPLAATVYELERLRCNACGPVFTAQEPDGIGPEKYDETAAAMIAQ